MSVAEAKLTVTPYGGVAQLGEHLPCKQGVMGSNPIISTHLLGVLKRDEKDTVSLRESKQSSELF